MFPEEISVAVFLLTSVRSTLVSCGVFSKHLWTDLDLKSEVTLLKTTSFFHHVILFWVKHSTICYDFKENRESMKEDRCEEEAINLLRLPWKPQHHAQD